MAPLRRRRAHDPEIARARRAFARLAEHVDAAQRGLLAAVPTYWDPGVPLAQALADFEGNLREAERLMPEWRLPATEESWTRCAHAIRIAKGEAQRLRLDPDDLTFEQLNVRIGDVVAPLESFADAERALRDL